MNIAIIFDGRTPTIDIVFDANFDFLKAEGKVDNVDYFLDEKLPPLKKLVDYGVVIFVRSGSLRSIIAHAFLKEKRIKTVYYTDDYLIDVPCFSSVSKSYRKRTIFIAIHSMLASHLIVSTDSLKGAYGFPEKTTIIPGTLDCQRLRVSENTLKKRSEKIAESVNLVIVQSDRLFLSPKEIKYLQLAIADINKEVDLHIHTFGNINIECAPGVKMTNYPFVAFSDFQRNLSVSPFHIAIAPITNMTDDAAAIIFSECKNKIKFLNFSLAGIPTIYSEAYRKKIEYDFCIFSDNSRESWRDGILRLLRNPSLRSDQIEKSLTAVCSNYDIRNSSELFFEVLRKLNATHEDRQKFPGMSIAYSLFYIIRLLSAAKLWIKYVIFFSIGLGKMVLRSRYLKPLIPDFMRR